MAESLAGRISLDRLHAVLRDQQWTDGSSPKLSVALSGGADSVVMLLLIWWHFPLCRKTLLVLHFDHCLRGPASAADARFCQRLCASLNVPMIQGRWDKRPVQVSEATARDVRMRFFETTLKRRRRSVLCLGHHQDDVAETLLMRLARGSGSAGLSAPRPMQKVGQRVHLRPLLGLRRDELREALHESGGTWREDASNETRDFFRNRIRRDVLPVWSEAAGRDAVAGAALTRELLEEDDAALDLWAARVMETDAEGRLHVKPLAGIPRAVSRRILRRWLNTVSPQPDLSRLGFAGLLTLVERGGFFRFSLDRDRLVVRRRGWLGIEPAKLRLP